jgi:hypothetical protein
LKGVDEQTIVEKNLRKNMGGLPSWRWVSTHVLECFGVFGRRYAGRWHLRHRLRAGLGSTKA